MVRVTNSVASKKRKKRIKKRAKGFWGDRKNHLRVTKNAVMKAMSFSTEHRKTKKRDFRRLWIIRIGVACRIGGLSYSQFIFGLKKIGCLLDRKSLSEMAVEDPSCFAALVSNCKSAIGLS